jgi:hypothetical protein
MGTNNTKPGIKTNEQRATVTLTEENLGRVKGGVSAHTSTAIKGGSVGCSGCTPVATGCYPSK